MDYAALVTTGELSYGELITKIAILPTDGSIVFTDQNSFNHTVLSILPKLSIIKGNDGSDNSRKVKVKFDAIYVNNHDGGGYFIYWTGTTFDFLYSEG